MINEEIELQQKIKKLNILEEKCKALNEELECTIDEIEPLKLQIADIKLNDHFKDGISIEKIMSLPRSTLDGCGLNWYRKITNYIDSLPGIHHGALVKNNDQIHLEIKLVKNIPLQQQRTIEQIYPLIKPLKEGYISISIFEHTLGENGIYELKVSTQEEPLTLKLTHKICGVESIKQIFSTWDDALTYIHKYHYYKK